MDTPRDLVGYGRHRPHARWPNGARVAVSFVLNYEEGGERSVMDGDAHAETYLVPEIANMPAVARRSASAEALFEYGSRAGFWRILRLFEERRLPFTAWAVGLALARNPEAGIAMAEAGHEVASHSWRWIDYADMPEEQERQHIRQTVEAITRIAGAPPLGWYTGRCSANTRRLVMEETETLYDSDCYDDDLPHWVRVGDRPRLLVPYALDTNDFKFALSPGWSSGDDFRPLSAGRLRPALRRGRANARDDVHRPALPADRTPGSRRRAGPLHGPRAGARRRLDLPPRRDRPALDGAPPVPRVTSRTR